MEQQHSLWKINWETWEVFKPIDPDTDYLNDTIPNSQYSKTFLKTALNSLLKGSISKKDYNTLTIITKEKPVIDFLLSINTHKNLRAYVRDHTMDLKLIANVLPILKNMFLCEVPSTSKKSLLANPGYAVEDPADVLEFLLCFNEISQYTIDVSFVDKAIVKRVVHIGNTAHSTKLISANLDFGWAFSSNDNVPVTVDFYLSAYKSYQTLCSLQRGKFPEKHRNVLQMVSGIIVCMSHFMEQMENDHIKSLFVKAVRPYLQNFFSKAMDFYRAQEEFNPVYKDIRYFFMALHYALSEGLISFEEGIFTGNLWVICKLAKSGLLEDSVVYPILYLFRTMPAKDLARAAESAEGLNLDLLQKVCYEEHYPGFWQLEGNRKNGFAAFRKSTQGKKKK